MYKSHLVKKKKRKCQHWHDVKKSSTWIWSSMKRSTWKWAQVHLYAQILCLSLFIFSHFCQLFSLWQTFWEVFFYFFFFINILHGQLVNALCAKLAYQFVFAICCEKRPPCNYSGSRYLTSKKILNQPFTAINFSASIRESFLVLILIGYRPKTVALVPKDVVVVFDGR